MTEKRLKYMEEHANYVLKNGGYNCNPVPAAQSVIELVAEVRRLKSMLPKSKGGNL